jgi:hypothetical protein
VVAVDTVRRLSVILAVVLSIGVALGQDYRGGRNGRGRSRGGDRASGDRSSRRGDSRMEAFLRRIDTNGNGMIDAEEVDGDHKALVEGILSRLGVQLKYPISLSKIAPAATNSDHTEAGGNEAGGGSSRSENKPSSGDPGAVQPKNGFGQPKPSQPTVPGFGQASDQSSGGPAKSVSTSAPSGVSASSSASAPAKSGDTPAGSAAANSEPPPDPPKRSGPKSGRFLTPKERLAKGLPEWFAEKDADGDGQVTMAEFAGEWTADTVAEFKRNDLNHDGIVTPAECLKATNGRRSK